MAQTLMVKLRRPDGTETTVKVRIIRSWGDSSGRSVFLHADGRYAYKSGAPLRDERELDIISNFHHRRVAQAWWKVVGEKRSREYYVQQAAMEAERAGDHRTVDGADSELDMVLYCKRSAGSNDSWGDPLGWMGSFRKRPDWWGVAPFIRFEQWEYQLFESRDEQGESAVGDGGGAASDVNKEFPDLLGIGGREEGSAGDEGAPKEF